MLSTSILYCNKLDENVLIGSPSCREPSTGTDSAVSRNVPPHCRKASSLPGSSSCVSNNSRHLKSIDSGAISVLSEPVSSSNVGGRRSYRVRYLGCHTCDHRSHRLENGIAAYQKPLLDLYTSVLRRSVVLRSLYPSFAVLNQVADFSDHGIVIAERDRFHTTKQQQIRQEPTRPNSSVSATSSQQKPIDTVVTKVITPLSNILLWAAVKFQHRTSLKKAKNSAIKRRQIGVAFVPLSCSDAVLDKNAFVTLNSKQRFLLGLPHPPLFACVLQKVNSAQRLECHLFVCLSSDDAVRMCNRMAELRQQSTSIGRLHIPLSGQMGSYSYQNSIPSSATSVVSNSRSSNYTFSDLSSNFTPKHYFSANSDIEEEVDDVVICHKQTQPQQSSPNSLEQTDSFESSATSIQTVQNSSKQHLQQQQHQQRQKQANSQEFANQSNSNNLKLKCDLRLYNRTKKISQQSSVGSSQNTPSSGNGHRLPSHNQHNLQVPPHSWADLSSLSSGIISIKSSEPSHNPHRHQHRSSSASSMLSAQRDYRFQSYKCPENYVLPTEMLMMAKNRKPLSSSVASSVLAIDSRVHSSANKSLANDPNANSTPTGIQKGLVNETLVNRQRQTPISSKSNGNVADLNEGVKQVNANDELQNNRLFAQASAKAAFHSVESESPSRASNANHQNLKPKISAVECKPGIESKQRFFGDSLKTSKSYGQLSVAKPLANDPVVNIHKQNNYRPSKSEFNIKNVQTNGKTSSAQVLPKQTVSTKPNDLKSHYKMTTNFNKPNKPLKVYRSPKSHMNGKLETTISNSLFFDNEDECTADSDHSKNGEQIQRSNSEDTLYYYERNCQAKQKKPSDIQDPINKTLSVPNITKSTKRQINDKNNMNGHEVVLYLPESTNLGVKGFNKSTPVEKWSTMIATNPSNGTSNNSPDNDCQLCSLDISCEECCSFCQSIDHQNLQFCSDCVLNEDDIALDESLLKNFSQENSLNSTGDKNFKPELNLSSKLEKEGLFQYDMYMTNVPRIDVTSNQFAAPQNKSFFGRMRRITWRSIFGTRKNGTGSRIWTRIQSGSQRLKGSKRFSKKRALKEPANRIFLPEQNVSSANQIEAINNYGECYLNANMLSHHHKQHKSTGDLKVSQNNDHRDHNRMRSTESNNSKQNGSTDHEAIRNKSDKPKLKPKPTAIGANGHCAANNTSGNNQLKVDSNADSIKPFFLSHPTKLSTSNGCINQTKSPMNGAVTATNQNHILSMSSDSGMEEYDCHSSNENSPLGYSSRLIPDMSFIDYEKLKSKMFANKSKPTTNGLPKDNTNRRQQVRKDDKMCRQDQLNIASYDNQPYHFKHQQQQQLKPNESSNNKNISSKMVRPNCAKVVHGRPSTNGQWSNSNIENELGYMP